jgi:hypothetical protein
MEGPAYKEPYEWFCTRVRTNMDLQMRLLIEAFTAARHVTLVSLLLFLTRFAFFFLESGLAMSF